MPCQTVNEVLSFFGQKQRMSKSYYSMSLVAKWQKVNLKKRKWTRKTCREDLYGRHQTCRRNKYVLENMPERKHTELGFCRLLVSDSMLCVQGKVEIRMLICHCETNKTKLKISCSASNAMSYLATCINPQLSINRLRRKAWLNKQYYIKLERSEFIIVLAHRHSCRQGRWNLGDMHRMRFRYFVSFKRFPNQVTNIPEQNCSFTPPTHSVAMETQSCD